MTAAVMLVVIRPVAGMADDPAAPLPGPSPVVVVADVDADAGAAVVVVVLVVVVVAVVPVVVVVSVVVSAVVPTWGTRREAGLEWKYVRNAIGE